MCVYLKWGIEREIRSLKAMRSNDDDNHDVRDCVSLSVSFRRFDGKGYEMRVYFSARVMTLTLLAHFVMFQDEQVSGGKTLVDVVRSTSPVIVVLFRSWWHANDILSVSSIPREERKIESSKKKRFRWKWATMIDNDSNRSRWKKKWNKWNGFFHFSFFFLVVLCNFNIMGREERSSLPPFRAYSTRSCCLPRLNRFGLVYSFRGDRSSVLKSPRKQEGRNEGFSEDVKKLNKSKKNWWGESKKGWPFSQQKNERIDRRTNQRSEKKNLAWAAGYVWKDFLTSLNVVPISTRLSAPLFLIPLPFFDVLSSLLCVLPFFFFLSIWGGITHTMYLRVD